NLSQSISFFLPSWTRKVGRGIGLYPAISGLLMPLDRRQFQCTDVKILVFQLKLSNSFIFDQFSWPTRTYKKIYNWQVSRGFDPKTTDFACYLGCPIYVTTPQTQIQLEKWKEDAQTI
ncbi:hypothetical protein L218DRAFT_309855, partial [Marasmius fiardii PR-910]